jgi:hypothetical protein
MVEFAEQLGGYKQPTLSQFETRPEGPPLDLVERYSDFFELAGKSRFDFFVAALESSRQLNIDIKKLPLTIRESLFKLLALFLSNKVTGEIIEKRKAKPIFGITKSASDPYEHLEKSWQKLETAITDLVEEGVKHYMILPEPTPKTAPLKAESPDRQ